MGSYSAHVDTFAIDNLPPTDQQADYLFKLDELQYPERLNCATELIDKKIQQGLADRVAIKSSNTSWTYEELLKKSNQIAHVLKNDMGLVPGNRVLIRSPNNPMMAACWLGIAKAGCVVVATMPLLRAQDLEPIIKKAEIDFALCDERLKDELFEARDSTQKLEKIILFNGSSDDISCELEEKMSRQPVNFENVDTAATDVVLIAFTSGTTGNPKGTMHFHRDVMTMCICAGDKILQVGEDDVFIGSPPLAFTYGLGILLAIPLHVGGTTVLLETGSPIELAHAIDEFQATLCATAPTGYRQILNNIDDFDFSSLRKSLSGGDVLPLPSFLEWEEKTGLKMMNAFGTTEMIHMFVSATEDKVRAEKSGTAVPGYEVKIVDDNFDTVPANTQGKLAIRGPTGCKYLADERQKSYVVNGWNITGDICEMDEEGYVTYISRADDMIISSGYNISSPEVEAALLPHDAVAECAVVGLPDEERGMIVKAFVVLSQGIKGSDELVKELQDFVKQNIAPYKYPRAIEFIDSLPKTQTGKIQRNKLRDRAI